MNFAKDQSDDYHSKDSPRRKDAVLNAPVASSCCQAEAGEPAASESVV